MFIVSYDDRMCTPDYFTPFISNTLRFSSLYLISPAKYLPTDIQTTLNEYHNQVTHVDPGSIPGYRHVQDLFDSVFVNYSTNSDQFERACFHRWFAINSLTASLSEKEYICLLDTDFLIGMHPFDVLSLCQSKFGSIPLDFIAEWDIDTQVSVGPELTIMTKKFLYGFCEFLLTKYFSASMKSQLMSEYFERIGNGLAGGICDMRALSSFVKMKHRDSSFNLNAISSPLLIANFNAFLSGSLGCNDYWNINLNSGKYVLQTPGLSTQLIGIHFQGSAKQYMNLLGHPKHVVSLDSSICMEHQQRMLDARRKPRLFKIVAGLWARFVRKLRVVFGIPN